MLCSMSNPMKIVQTLPRLRPHVAGGMGARTRFVVTCKETTQHLSPNSATTQLRNNNHCSNDSQRYPTVCVCMYARACNGCVRACARVCVCVARLAPSLTWKRLKNLLVVLNLKRFSPSAWRMDRNMPIGDPHTRRTSGSKLRSAAHKHTRRT